MSENIKIVKIALVENFAADFFKARLNLYNSLIEKGYAVTAIFPNENDENSEVELENFAYPFTRNTFNPKIILKDFYGLYRHFKNKKYDVIHTFRFHPNLYINVISIFLRDTAIINHVTGLGIAFSKSGVKGRLSKIIYTIILQFNLFCSNRIIVQNNEDFRYLSKLIFGKRKVRLILGSGINTVDFVNDNVNRDKITELKKSIFVDDSITFTIITRLIKQKGIIELVEAFKSLSSEGEAIPAKLIIVGWFDKQNPNTINKTILKNLPGNIIFLGKRNDVKEILSLSDIFILPSYYREGVPRSILEALSMGKPIITTDMPGCKETVVHKQNGFIIKPQNKEAIIESVMYFIDNIDKIKSFGVNSRERAITIFSSAIVNEKIHNLYEEVLA
ncbi:MAG: glycosyltransferase family 4 protein [Bacillota bacterium]